MAAGRPRRTATPATAEIVHPPVWAENTLYAGFTYTGWLYAAYSWNLTGELVPEPYLNPLSMVPEEQRKHSNGFCINQAPEPEFWTEGNANKV